MPGENRENDLGEILRNLKQPGGASRKPLRSREVPLLPSVLSAGELSEFIVSSNPDAIPVATDRRLLHLHRSGLRGSIKRLRSFP